MFRFESPLRIYRWGYNAGITSSAVNKNDGFQVLEVSLGHRRHGLVHPYLDLTFIISEHRGRHVLNRPVFGLRGDRKEFNIYLPS